MNEHTDTAEWFYADATRQQQGPLSAAELRERHARGELRADTLVWKSGMADWLPLHEAIGLAASVPVVADPLPSHASIMPAGAEIDRSDIVYAGFWRRVAAYQLDSLIIGTLSYILILPIAMMMGLGSAGLASQSDPEAMLAMMMPMLVVMYLVMFAAQASYFAWMHARPAQATLGKMAVGIKVVRPDGSRISFWRGIGRWFGLLLSALPLCIGFLMAAFTDRKQALHDMACDTLVVDRWAFTNQPQLQKRGLDGVTIAVLVIMGLFILFGIGIMVLMVAALGSGSWR